MTGLPGRGRGRGWGMGRREGRYCKDSLCKGGVVMEESSVLGKYSDAELVARLKGLALDPCNSEYSRTKIRPFWNQTISVRKALAMADTEFPRRKWKLQQLLKALPGYGNESSNQQGGRKLSRRQVSHASSTSCFLNSVESAESFDQKTLLESHGSNSLLTFEDDLLEKHIYSESTFMVEPINCNSPSKDVFRLVDSDDSVKCSSPVSPENLTSQEVPSMNFNDIGHHSNSDVLATPNQKHLQPPRRSIRLLNFIGDHLQRVVVPVGPPFQADVPDWTDLHNGETCDSEDSKWLGTRIWPIEGRKTKFTRVVGKGRPESCSCLSTASIECVQRHILEERILLLCDVGPAYFRWKLDEMGEAASKSWTLEEQHNFESIARIKPPLSNGKDFWKRALKCFPSKSRKAIISYYFNVFIPRRMSMQNKSSCRQVDTDEDEVKNSDHLDFQHKFDGRTLIGSSKVVKARFLCRPS